MAEQNVLVRCYNCGGDTECTLQILDSIPATSINQQQGIDKSVSCKYCGRLNIITIPASWDDRPLVLDDDSFLGYNQGRAIMQGKRV